MPRTRGGKATGVGRGLGGGGRPRALLARLGARRRARGRPGGGLSLLGDGLPGSRWLASRLASRPRLASGALRRPARRTLGLALPRYRPRRLLGRAPRR